MLKYLIFLLCMILSPVVYGAGQFFEAISVTAATATTSSVSELAKAKYDSYPYVNGVYSFSSASGTSTLFVRIDGGTATVSGGIPYHDKDSFLLRNITDMRKLNFISNTAGTDTVYANYSVSRKDDN